MTDQLVLAVVGPTAAGKSRIALEAARSLRAEIIAVDAFTVYRGMDIGTAKPSAQERAEIPHHMIDVLSVDQSCSVEWFQSEARRCIADVLERGGLPLLVGGSGLYFRAVVDPLDFPPTDPDVRARMEAAYADDPSAAHAALREADPEAAGRMEPGNVRRAIRALEVLEITGRPFSSYRQAWDTHDAIYPALRVTGVQAPRAELGSRIDARVDRMLRDGLVDECRALLEAVGPGSRTDALSATARQAIGYAEVVDHLEGACSLAEASERIKARTRRYAARQMRWFRGDPRVRWTAASSAVAAIIADGRHLIANEVDG
ncbi:MAG TPA: tRNA (adenosine(37)-N6)-dimethylallyltransferase MiaA [Egibacteraceae bacterium]|nr:tRNA (adenosine(37)-N6)-dimethylallyltransferase MiaA [Egibacteraceae bacterium]